MIVAQALWSLSPSIGPLISERLVMDYESNRRLHAIGLANSREDCALTRDERWALDSI